MHTHTALESLFLLLVCCGVCNKVKQILGRSLAHDLFQALERGGEELLQR
jgi:hypothetical protein